MAVKTRPDGLPYSTGIDAAMLTRASKLVSAVSSFPVQYNKAIVGRNAFAHESGIHQDGVLKNALTYEIMTPESVGLAKNSLVMGKHSGRAAFKDKLRDLGYVLGDNAMQDAFVRFKALADKKKIVYDEDIEALVDDEIAHKHERIKLASLVVQAGTKGPQTAEIALDHRRREPEASSRRATAPSTRSSTPSSRWCRTTRVLELYQVHAVTQGTDAQAEVSVRLVEGDKQVTARVADPDTMVASARAYVGALNKLMMKRGKVRPRHAGGLSVARTARTRLFCPTLFPGWTGAGSFARWPASPRRERKTSARRRFRWAHSSVGRAADS